jgi:hypothetical protein
MPTPSTSPRRTRSVVRTALIGAAMVGLLASGAFAYFTASGSATASATATTMQTVTVAALAGGDTPSSALSPGGPAADVVLRVTNPNTFSVSLHDVAGAGAITADAGHSGCTTTGVSFTPPADPGVTLPPGSSLVHLAGAASMSSASLSACQGATFTIPVTITVRR